MLGGLEQLETTAPELFGQLREFLGANALRESSAVMEERLKDYEAKVMQTLSLATSS